MEIAAIWIVCAIVAAIVASNKGRSGVGWFFGALLLTPLMVLILLALPNLKVAAAAQREIENSKQCPRCAERVKAEAEICRFCGHSFGTTIDALAEREPLRFDDPPPTRDRIN